jgi:hypothetical protein
MPLLNHLFIRLLILQGQQGIDTNMTFKYFDRHKNILTAGTTMIYLKKKMGQNS